MKIRSYRSFLLLAVFGFAMLAMLEVLSRSSALAQAVTGASGAAPAPRFVGSTQPANTVRPLSSLPAAPAAPAPGAPVALSTTSALPQLAPAPVVVQAAAPAQPGTFRCSCFGIGTGTRWVGVVQAMNFTQADAAAEGQCVNFLMNDTQGSPYLPLGGSGFTTRSPFPAVNPNIPPGDVAIYRGGVSAQTMVSAAASGAATVASYCQRCSCN